jgi:hypothetical protein
MTKFDQLLKELVNNTNQTNPQTPVQNNQGTTQPAQQVNQQQRPPATTPVQPNKPVDGNVIINALANNNDPKTFDALKNAKTPQDITKVLTPLLQQTK